MLQVLYIQVHIGNKQVMVDTEDVMTRATQQ